MRALTRIVVLTLLLTACTDIISPPRVERYEYRRAIPIENGTLLVAFQWPREMLPIRIWIDDEDPLRPMLIRAIAMWENAFLYGEFRAELVADQPEADILVHNEVAPGLLRANTRVSSMAPQCRGATDWVVDTERRELLLPFQMYVWSRIGPDGEGLENCFELTMLHEIGHAIGIFEHSPHPDDLMFGDPTRNSISDRDRATAEAVMHLPSNVAPIRP